MKITLAPVPVQQTTEQMIMAGTTRIGSVKTLLTNDGGTRYHAVLAAKSAWSVYQGFGDTVDEAMRDAVNTSRASRINEIAELDNLENVIWGDHEIN